LRKQLCYASRKLHAAFWQPDGQWNETNQKAQTVRVGDVHVT